MPPLRRVLTALALAALLVPALLLTTLRLVQPTSGWAVRSISFTPFGLPLYAAALLVLLAVLVRAVRGRAGTRPVLRVAAAAVGVLVLGLLHLSWLLPAYSGEAPPAAPGTPRLRVLTSNVLHDGARASDILALARRADADLVVLQEVTRRQWDDLRAAGVARAYPHSAGVAGPGKPGTIVLGRSPVDRARSLDTVGDNVLVRARLGQRSVGLLAVHARYPELPTAWRKDHAEIADEVRRTAPALVVGDFNATYDHAAMQRYRALGYRSAAEILDLGWEPTWPDDGHREVLGLPLPRLVHIDHVMVSRHLTAVSVEHLDLPGSDHMAVAAEVGLR